MDENGYKAGRALKSLKPVAMKRPGKRAREHRVLLGLVDYYLKTGQPVGSNTLKEAGFHDLSSATIRNYFARLEGEGYLMQQHASGGRVPTGLAYRVYADEHRDATTIDEADEAVLRPLRTAETREIASFLEGAAETLSALTRTAVFLSAPRFDHDVVLDVKLIRIDIRRCLCVLITDFGVIKTEVFHTPEEVKGDSLERMENYFRWRIRGGRDKPKVLSEDEETLAQQLYNELMVRYIVGYSNFSHEEIHSTGFSQLLSYPDFGDVTALSNSLSLFENPNSMRLLLRECVKGNALKFWVGEDLQSFHGEHPNCSVVAIPYQIGPKVVGGVGLLGPLRIPYRQLFGILRVFSDYVSEALTNSIYKFKISFREPRKRSLKLDKRERILLEDKRKK